MRTIPSDVQTLLETDLGVEIILVLEVQWGSGIDSAFYADRTIAGTPVKGKILSLSGFDEAVLVSGGGQSQQIAVTLDDTEGDIKAVFDANDVHKAPATIWFYVAGTDWSTKKFEVGSGQINSPVVWSEGLRQFSFTIVNRIEDVETGFSAEEGAFPALPEELIGKPWPLCFGTTINVPALKAVPAISGSLAAGVGIKDFTLPGRIALATAITCPRTPVGYKCRTTNISATSYNAVCNTAYEDDQSCLQSRCLTLERLRLQLEEQTNYEYKQITIFGGEQFPQDRTITLNINGGLFTGYFTGTKTNPDNLFVIMSRKHPEDDGTGKVIEDPLGAIIEAACPSAAGSQDSDFTETAWGPVFTGMRSSRISWEKFRAAKAAGFFWAPGGASVAMEDTNEVLYISNILPSTVLRVAAWRTINGNRFLLTVPDDLFVKRQTNYLGYQVTEIVFDKPLSTEQLETGGGWTDDILVTSRSSVGPNPIVIMKWFINTYTNYNIDSASFTPLQTSLDVYSMHTPILVRRGLLDILQALAAASRCALWLRGDTFYIKYLSATPSPVATIAEDDVLQDSNGAGSLQIGLTKTEDLVTQVTAKWKSDYSIAEDNQLILRHNVKKYGTHKKELDYKFFAHLQMVKKSATFWLIRWANTWKKLRLLVSLEYTKLEAFDAVTINLPDVASTTFPAIVERAVLDSANKQIELELWTPIRAGEITPYDFAFPAAIAQSALYPTIEAREQDQAGSGTEPNFSTIAPAGHPLRADTKGIYQGLQLGCNGAGVVSLKPGECRQDHGDRNPSDIGDEKPTVETDVDGTGDTADGTSPVTDGAGDGFWSKEWEWDEKDRKQEGDGGRGRENGQREIKDPQITPDDDWLRDLPDPDDLDEDEHPCQVRVKATGFRTKEYGPSGRRSCIPASSAWTDIFIYNSKSEADAACAAMKAESQCGGSPPCGDCVSCIVTSKVGDKDCEPADGDQPGVIGFRSGNPDWTHLPGARGGP